MFASALFYFCVAVWIVYSLLCWPNVQVAGRVVDM